MQEIQVEKIPLSRIAANVPLKRFANVMIEGGKIRDFCKLYSLLGSGNYKLPTSTAIYNLSSAHSCPSFKLGFCQAILKKGKKAGTHVCYAKRSENSSRPFVQPYRDAQKKYWETITAEEFVTQFLLINSTRNNPWTSLRFNESGDFHNQNDLDKVEKVARLLNRFNVKTYCYSARKDLNFKNVRHLIVSGSGFQKEGIPNIFLMIEDKKDRPKGYGVCKGDCRVCNRCQVRGSKMVILRH